jgi:tripartite-type tricarboxylate transporter receptor subunit TctC
MKRRQALASVLILAVGVTARPQTLLSGETYPSRPLKLIVTSSPGGVQDVLVRLIAERLARNLGQAVVVENRPGASGAIGAAAGSKAPADGYTITSGTSSALAVAPAMGQPLGFDINDLQPITLGFMVPLVLLVNPALGVSNVQELVALAKSRPGQLNYAVTGYAGTNHVVAEMFSHSMGIEVLHVPYKGDAEALMAVLSRHVQFTFGFPSTSLPQIHAGKLRALLVTAKHRLPALPNVPTSAEAGIENLELYAWGGFFVPRGTPAAILSRLHGALVTVLLGADLKARAEQEGSIIGANSPEEFRNFIEAEQARFARIVTVTGIKK